MKYCTWCGASVTLRIPEGDDRERYVCTACEEIHYINPRVIVGCVPVHEGRVLLCRSKPKHLEGIASVPAAQIMRPVQRGAFDP